MLEASILLYCRDVVKEQSQSESGFSDSWQNFRSLRLSRRVFRWGGAVDVVKMDIEGYEPFVIMGMERTISASKSLVMISELAHSCLERAGVTAQQFVEQLESLGFSVSVIYERSKELREMSGAVLDGINSDPTWSANLYCKKRD